jgi:hypothetical protein
MHHDDETPAERMIRELGIAPSLGERIDEGPLLRQARKNVDETVRHAHDVQETEEDPPSP